MKDFESLTSDRGDSFQHRCTTNAHILAQMQHRCMHVAPMLWFHAVFELAPTVQCPSYLSLMDPEFVDDAKLMAITIVFAVGVCQIGRWILCAVRSMRDGVVHDAKYQTAQLMAGKKKIEQLRRRR